MAGLAAMAALACLHPAAAETTPGLAGCYSIDGPAGRPAVYIHQTGDSWRGDFQGAGGARLGVPLLPDLYSTQVMLEANGPFMAVRQAFTVAASLTGDSDIFARLDTPLTPPDARPDSPEATPAPFLWWARDDDMLLAWPVPCGG